MFHFLRDGSLYIERDEVPPMQCPHCYALTPMRSPEQFLEKKHTCWFCGLVSDADEIEWVFPIHSVQ